MPKQVLLSEEQFTEMAAQFTGQEMQFRPLPVSEYAHDEKRLGLVAPRTRRKEGVQEKFVFHARGYTVVVHTTFVRTLRACRPVDTARVLIVCRDTVLYMSRDIRRTKHFARRLLAIAWIARWKVMHRPCCPECGAHMDIAHKKYRKYWWTCTRVREHGKGKPIHLDWDAGLPEKALAFLEKARTQSRKYRARRIKAGKEPFAALRKRKAWTRTKAHHKE
jgi:hypothetical protein